MTDFEALYCDHTAMTECCPGCGHFSCPCGITWDEGAEGHFFFEDDDPNDPSFWEGVASAA